MSTAVDRAPVAWSRRRGEIALASTILLLGAAYFCGGKVGFALHPVSGFAAPVWPPTGMALAALLLGGMRLWPGVALGAFLLNVEQGAPWLVAGSIAAGNTFEATVGAYLLRGARFECGLARLRDVFSLVLAAAVSTTISPSIGVRSLVGSGTISVPAAGGTWFVWFVGDLLSALVIAPFLITLVAGLPMIARRVEVVAALTTVSVCALVFMGGFLPAGLRGVFGWPHLVYPALLWPSLRLGPRGSAASTAIIASVAVLTTSLGRGVFAEHDPQAALLALQLFVAVVAVTSLSLAAAVAESRYRDEIMSIAAHELRGPVGTIGLALQNVEDAVRRGLPGDQSTAAAEAARRQCGRLAALVGELLDATRAGSHALSVHPAEVDLASLASEVVSRLRPKLRAAGCDAKLELKAVRGVWDPLRVEQVLTNLLTNAIRHAPGAPIEISVEPLGDRARLTVGDRGPGIATRDQKRVFDAFRSLDRRSPGLGLGLHIVREIVVAHGGTIRLESALGLGARFVVELPLEPPCRRKTIGGRVLPL